MSLTWISIQKLDEDEPANGGPVVTLPLVEKTPCAWANGATSDPDVSLKAVSGPLVMPAAYGPPEPYSPPVSGKPPVNAVQAR